MQTHTAENDNSPKLSPEMVIHRIFWSAVFVMVAWALATVFAPAITIAAGNAAGGQFANSDIENLKSLWAINFYSKASATIFVGLLLALLWLWWKPARLAIRLMTTASALLAVIFAGQPADAYYDKTDWPEIYFILPNESAFWIPDTGANKDSQTAFMSEQYLAENKIAAKRFQVPHTKLTGSSYGFDFYIPAGRLIIVDRAPYAREWTKNATRGSTADNQALECQSKDGLDISLEIAISASVFEQNAAKFLYRFGVKPPVGDRNTPEVKFVSVFYGKSLTEVMDTVVHGKIQSLMCKYFSSRNLDAINSEADKIMDEGEKEVGTYLLKEFGITLDFIGYAGTFGFSETVQKALDDKFAADKVAPVLATLQAQARMKIEEGLGAGLAKHGLPANLISPNLDSMVGMFAGGKAVPNQTPAPRQ